MERTLSLEEIKKAFESLPSHPYRKGMQHVVCVSTPPKTFPFTGGITEEEDRKNLPCFLIFLFEEGEWKLVVDDGYKILYDAESVGGQIGSGSELLNKIKDSIRSGKVL